MGRGIGLTRSRAESVRTRHGDESGVMMKYATIEDRLSELLESAKSSCWPLLKHIRNSVSFSRGKVEQTMQYALFKVRQQELLLDANEMHSLNTFGDSIKDLPMPDEAGNYRLCYGSYMPQPNTDEFRARKDLKIVPGYWIGHVEEDKCHLIAISDVEVLEPPVCRLGKALYFPFAALIKASDSVIEKIGSKSRQGVTSFLRYESMSPATNVLNRPGIIALKGIERRRTEARFAFGWRRHIDISRAARIAADIF